jgi:gas vesicle protein
MATADRAVIFLTGMGIGIAGALCFAPCRGTETRRRIKRSASEAADYVAGGVNTLSDAAKGTLNDASKAAKKTLDTMVDKSREVADTAGKTMEQAGKRLQDA